MILLALAIAAEQPAPPVDLGQAVEVCRAYHHGDRERGKELFAAIPDQHKREVIQICIVYRAGVSDERLYGKGK